MHKTTLREAVSNRKNEFEKELPTNEFYATVKLPMILTCGTEEEEIALKKSKQINFKEKLDEYVVSKEENRIKNENFFGLTEEEILLNRT